MSDNWVVQNLQNALETWNEKLAEIWQLITTTPQNFKGGGIWAVIVNINGAVQAIGLALLVLFFVVGMVRTCGSFAEVKINREIRNYTEAMFFGLSMRQFIFSACACVMAVGLYFLLKPYVGTETVSWMCILGAAPFAALGFIKYNGMTAEKFVWAWFKSEFLMPKKLTFRSTNTYYEMMKPGMEHKQKEVSKAND